MTVEAASPELIEKVRSVVTDGSGQYRIVSLRPGLYSVTFTLPGFSTVKKEGLQLQSGIVTTVSADLTVGAVEETITVTGETPVVDVQSAKRQQTLSTEMLTSIPTARASNAILTLIPSMVTSGGGNNNVQLQPGMIVFGGRGGRGNEGRLQLDGLNTGASVNGGGVSGYTADVQNAAEITMAPSGGLGENEVGGPAMNIVPRTGGNTFKFYSYASFTGDKLQGSNFTPELQAAGLRAPGAINRLWDVSGSVGGPIVKDKVWFFSTLRHRGNYTDVVGMYYNKNAGDITKWTYEADTEPAGDQRVAHADSAAGADDDPGGTAQQGQSVLGRAEERPEPRRRVIDQLARDGVVQRRRIPAGPAGDLDLHRHEQASARSRRRHLPVRLGWQRAPRQQPRPDSGHRTVHGGMRDQRLHPRPQLPSAGELADRVDRRAHVARVGVVRDGQPQPEGRLPGRLSRRRSTDDADDQPHLPVQQRHPEPAHRVSVAAANTSRAFATTRSTRRTAGPATG